MGSSVLYFNRKKNPPKRASEERRLMAMVNACLVIVMATHLVGAARMRPGGQGKNGQDYSGKASHRYSFLGGWWFSPLPGYSLPVSVTFWLLPPSLRFGSLATGGSSGNIKIWQGLLLGQDG